MNTLASTSTACYTCVRARASGSNAAGFARFSTTRRNHRKDELWSVDKVRSHNELQTRDLLTELARMQKEDGVKVDKSVFGTEIGGKKM